MKVGKCIIGCLLSMQRTILLSKFIVWIVKRKMVGGLAAAEKDDSSLFEGDECVSHLLDDVMVAVCLFPFIF